MHVECALIVRAARVFACLASTFISPPIFVCCKNENPINQMSTRTFEGVLHPVFQEEEFTLIIAGAILGAIAGFLQMMLSTKGVRDAAKKAASLAAEKATAAASRRSCPGWCPFMHDPKRHTWRVGKQEVTCVRDESRPCPLCLLSSESRPQYRRLPHAFRPLQ